MRTRNTGGSGSAAVAFGLGIALALVVLLVLGSASAQAGDSGRAGSRAGEKFTVNVCACNSSQTINTTTHSAFYSVTVKNIGDTAGDVRMAMEFPPTASPGWDWVPIPGGDDKIIQSVFPAEVKSVSITVYAPIYEKAGTYTIVLSVTPSDNSFVYLKATVTQFGGLTLTAPPDVTVDPGARVDLPFTIKNTGNGDDTYTITRVDISVPTWGYTINGGTLTGKVKPGFQTTKTIQITVPFGADATAAGKAGVRVSITVVSTFDTSLRDGKGCNIRVTQMYAISFVSNRTDSTVRPGSTTDFEFIVSNNGNGLDNITINLTHSLTGWQVTLTKTSFNISRDVNRELILTLGPPRNALRGDYYLTILAQSTGPIDSPAEISYNLKVTVEQVYGFDLTIAKNTTAPVPPGGVAEFTFLAANIGNGNDNYNLTVDNVPNGWFASFDSPEIALSAYQNRTLALTIQVSPQAGQAIAKPYPMKVTGTSGGNATAFDVFYIQMVISETCGIDFSVQDTDTKEANPNNPSSTETPFVFDLKNTGNAPGEAITKVESFSWDAKLGITVLVTPERASMPAFGQTIVLVTVNVPKGTPVGLYDLTLSSSGSKCPEPKIPVTVHLKVINEDVRAQYIKFKLKTQPTFQEVKVYTVVLKETVQIAIGVLNNGSQIVHDVHVKITVGKTVVKEQTITSIGVLKAVVVQGEYNARFTGTFTVKADVTIAGDAWPTDNTITAKLKVREDCPPTDPACANTTTGGTDLFSLSPGSPLFLVLLVVILIVLGMVGKVAIRVKDREMSKDLYESIYGGEGGPQQPGQVQVMPPGQGPPGMPPPPPPPQGPYG